MEKNVFHFDVPAATKDTYTVAVEAPPARKSLSLWFVVISALGLGLLLTIFWSPSMADDVIGQNVANAIVGSKAMTIPLDSVFLGVIFALASGLATTFTACNCVVFSCIAPLAGEKQQRKLSVGRLLLLICGGVIIVTAIYGIVGALLGDRMPTLSQALVQLPVGRGYPVRLLQATIVFVVLGVVLLLWGAVSLQLIPSPFKRLTQSHAWIVPLFMGVIVGGFTIGRPFPLFQKLFLYSAETGNPLLSAGLIALQGLGNIALMTLLFALLMYGTRGYVERWLQNYPYAVRMLTAASLLIGGTFLILYWGLRVPAIFGIGWFPHI